MQFLYIGGL